MSEWKECKLGDVFVRCNVGSLDVVVALAFEEFYGKFFYGGINEQPRLMQYK